MSRQSSRHVATMLSLAVSALLIDANPLAATTSGIGVTNWNDLFARQVCVNPCGYAGQLCCGSGGACYTDSNNRAQCSATAGGGTWSYWTTVYTTEAVATLVTQTFSTYIVGAVGVPATATGAPAICNSPNEASCGPICCASNQYCAYSGQCLATAGASASPFGTPIAARTGTATTTVGFLSPVETGAGGSGDSGSGSGSGSGSSAAGAAGTTTTAASSTPTQDASGGGGGGLSGGAIAGIVIGSLAGLILLIALCVCCFVKGLWDLLFGGSRRRRRDYSDRRGGYYAGGRSSRRNGRRDALGIGAALAALAAWLGFRSRHDRRDQRRARYSEKASAYTDYEPSEVSNVRSAYSEGPSSYYDDHHAVTPVSPARTRDGRRERIVEETIWKHRSRR